LDTIIDHEHDPRIDRIINAIRDDVWNPFVLSLVNPIYTHVLNRVLVSGREVDTNLARELIHATIVHHNIELAKCFISNPRFQIDDVCDLFHTINAKSKDYTQDELKMVHTIFMLVVDRFGEAEICRPTPAEWKTFHVLEIAVKCNCLYLFRIFVNNTPRNAMFPTVMDYHVVLLFLLQNCIEADKKRNMLPMTEALVDLYQYDNPTTQSPPLLIGGHAFEELVKRDHTKFLIQMTTYEYRPAMLQMMMDNNMFAYPIGTPVSVARRELIEMWIRERKTYFRIMTRDLFHLLFSYMFGYTVSSRICEQLYYKSLAATRATTTAPETKRIKLI
jgi:hypothetical protein